MKQSWRVAVLTLTALGTPCLSSIIDGSCAVGQCDTTGNSIQDDLTMLQVRLEQGRRTHIKATTTAAVLDGVWEIQDGWSAKHQFSISGMTLSPSQGLSLGDIIPISDITENSFSIAYGYGGGSATYTKSTITFANGQTAKKVDEYALIGNGNCKSDPSNNKSPTYYSRGGQTQQTCQDQCTSEPLCDAYEIWLSGGLVGLCNIYGAALTTAPVGWNFNYADGPFEVTYFRAKSGPICMKKQLAFHFWTTTSTTTTLGCVPGSEDTCRETCRFLGLGTGNGADAFAGNYGVKGCYMYSEADKQNLNYNKGDCFFGTGGTPSQKTAHPAAPKYRVPGSLCEPCDPYTEQACLQAALMNGLHIGGSPDKAYEFAGDYSTKGCYYYSNGDYAGYAYYGLGGTLEENEAPVSGDYKLRVPGYDCSVVEPGEGGSYIYGSWKKSR
mmetsp:Transcript_145532/g.268314  ORF Transcript_145532/g.268314 Transcript_145532/m.268314 type:complete len:440 (-) Transcript_145532:165-1484(-)